MGSVVLLSVVLILSLRLPGMVLACPQLCACYFPTEIHCTFRSLTAVPAAISKHVERINLGFNSIQSVSESSFSGLDKLELLMLHGNDIQRIPDGAFRDLRSLQVLKMSYNKVDVITGETFRGLRSVLRLHADHNKITFIHPGAFYGLTSLKLLHLEGNRLGRLHPRTFITFSFLQYFEVSSIRYLYLSDNSIQSLPHRVFQSMPQLESIYLHGNPWECDCQLKWLLDWEKQAGGPVKCKKDRTYPSGQVCSSCSKPQHLAGSALSKLRASDVECHKPRVRSPLKKFSNVTATGWREEVETDELAEPDYRPLVGEVAVNLTDRHGENRVELRCRVTGPVEHGTQMRWELPGSDAVDARVNVNLTVEMVCAVDREQLSRLWTLTAYYSEEFPLILRRIGATESGGWYRQDEGPDYRMGGVRADILAEPAWLMQPVVAMRLDRRRTSGSQAVLSLATSLYRRFTSHHDEQELARRPWVLISETLTEHLVLTGAMLRLNCPAVTSAGSDDELPSVEWTLPDGATVRAPFDSADNRLSASVTGVLTIRAVDGRDSGPYRCTRRVEGDWDSVTYRVAVVLPEPRSLGERPVMVRARSGEAVSLPCVALAVPEARLSWLLPGNQVVSAPNGTLEVEVGLRGGRYTCVAVNRYGADSLTVRLLVDRPIRPSRVSGPRVLVRPAPQEREGSGRLEAAAVFGEARAQRRGNTRRLHRGPGRKAKPRPGLRSRSKPGNGSQLRAAEGRRWVGWGRRRRPSGSTRKIDPQRWADILARVRGKATLEATQASQPGKVKGLGQEDGEGEGEEGSGEGLKLSEEGLIEEAVLSGRDGQEGSGGIGLGEGAPGGGGHETRDITKPGGHGNQGAGPRTMASHGATTHPTGLTTATTTITTTNKSTITPTTMTKTSTSSTKVSTIVAKDMTSTTQPPTLMAKTFAGITISTTTSTPTSEVTSVTNTPTPTTEVYTRRTKTLVTKHSTARTTPTQTLTNIITSKTITKAEVLPATTKTAAITTMAPVSTTVLVSVTDPSLQSTTVSAEPTSPTRPSPTLRSTLRPTAKSSARSPSTASRHLPRKRLPGSRRYRPNRYRHRPRFRPAARGKPAPAPSVIRPSVMAHPSAVTVGRETLGFPHHAQPENAGLTVLYDSSDPPRLVTGISMAKPTSTAMAAATGTTTSRPATTSSWGQLLSETSQVKLSTTTSATGQSTAKGITASVSEPQPQPRRVPESAQWPFSFTPTQPSRQNQPLLPHTDWESPDAWSVALVRPSPPPSSVNSPETPESHFIRRNPPTVTKGGGGASNGMRFITGITKGPLESTAPTVVITAHRPHGAGGTQTEEVEPALSGSPSPPNPATSEMSVIRAWLDGDTSTWLDPMSSQRPDFSMQAPNLMLEPHARPGLESETARVPSTKIPDHTTGRAEINPYHQPPDTRIYPHAPTSARSLTTSLTIGTRGGPETTAIGRVPSTVRPPIINTNTEWGEGRQVDLQLPPIFGQVDISSSFRPAPRGISPTPHSPKESSSRGTTLGPTSPRKSYPRPYQPKESSPNSHSAEEIFPSERYPGPGSPIGNSSRFHRPKESSTTSHSPKEISRIESFLGLSSPKPHSPQASSPREHYPGPSPPRETSPRLHSTKKSSPGLHYTKENSPRSHSPQESYPGLNSPGSTVSRSPNPSPSRKSPTITNSPSRKSLPTVAVTMATTHLYRVTLLNRKPPRFPMVPQVRESVANSSSRGSQPLPGLREAAKGKPKITSRHLHTVSVQAGKDAMLPCSATGEPKPWISWTKVPTGMAMAANTKTQRFKVLPDGNFSIRAVELQDRGQFLCAARNQHGVDKALVTLVVLSQPPRVTVPRHREAAVYLGATFTADCHGGGLPPPRISWLLPDGAMLRAPSTPTGQAAHSRPVVVLANGTLAMTETTFSDRGLYRCVVDNGVGVDVATVRLHVSALPPIIGQGKMENVSVPTGGGLYVDCTAKAAPPPRIHWTLPDGTQIKPSQFINGNIFVFPNGTLYIRNATGSHSGHYECLATNLVGLARRGVRVRVETPSAPARITAPSPHRVDVVYGSSLHLDCQATGDPQPKILWRLPTMKLVDSRYSHDDRIKVYPNGTLSILVTTDKDRGDYLCVARNRMGDDFLVQRVGVAMAPAKIRYKPEAARQLVTYGKDLRVDCEASGLPDPQVSWGLPDGTKINSLAGRSRRYVVFGNGSLYFNQAGPKDEGEYTCYAVNQVGKDEMRVSVKVVSEPPTIQGGGEGDQETVEIPAGESFSLPCQAKGQPRPWVAWFSPANRYIPASSSKYRVGEDGTLWVKDGQSDDSGNYTCLARNGAGEARRVVMVRVKFELPRILTDAGEGGVITEMVLPGARKLIDCRVEGLPAPTVTWHLPGGVSMAAASHRDGRRVTVHANGTLDIRNAGRTDTGRLRCVAANQVGEAELSVRLELELAVEEEPAVKPSFADSPSSAGVISAATGGRAVRLDCSSRGHPPPDTVWYLPGGQRLASGQRLGKAYHGAGGELHISQPTAAEAGEYRCLARNRAGSAERLVTLEISREPEPRSRYSGLVRVLNGENMRLDCAVGSGSGGNGGGGASPVTWVLPNGAVFSWPQSRGRFSLLPNGSLEVRQATVYDRGTYLCRASEGPVGAPHARVPVIVVAYPPRITTGPAPITYARRGGGSVRLDCSATGTPPAQVSWEVPGQGRVTLTHRGRLVGNKSLHSQGTLIIHSPTSSDTGFYRCLATNLLGSDVKTTYVHVY